MLSWRAGLAVRTARLVYSHIGQRIAQAGCNVFASRTYVPLPAKLWLMGRAMVQASAEASFQVQRSFSPATLSTVVRFPTDVLPI